jgi:hypothetical protein
MANIAFKMRDPFLLNHLKLQMSVMVPTLNTDTVCHSHAEFRVDEIISHIELSAHSNSFVLN